VTATTVARSTCTLAGCASETKEWTSHLLVVNAQRKQIEAIATRRRDTMGWRQHIYQAVLLGLFVTFLIRIS
jgi:hypothetical protein